MTEAATQLTGLILPRGESPMIGKEVGKEVRDGVALFFQSRRTFNPAYPYAKGGSYRFVRFVDGQIVAGLQVMSLSGQQGIVANVYCHPDWRRKGHATELLGVAREVFEAIAFDDDRSTDGEAWVAAQTEITAAADTRSVPRPR
ncbi:GNAT family N-acetyltransferase [Rhizobium laguerreae]|uniref:GNAT family N-acetyltransferase n=1 Tax=Rhizobium laguerreae TaxID=1076926 RepID=UPI001C915508|nr:GNAT family N-acetyltransferase [Rhizobium laguerreae]MBY3158351.1 GNAT family N-acetyltransferase [Rhizobium laguerreae]